MWVSVVHMVYKVCYHHISAVNSYPSNPTCVAEFEKVLASFAPPQSHRAKGLLELKQCKLYAVHPSLFGRWGASESGLQK